MKNNNEENEKAFKNFISEEVLDKLGSAILKVYPNFKLMDFQILKKNLKSLELKQRVELICAKLFKLLPQDYKIALGILIDATRVGDLRGFELWPFTHYINSYGLNDFTKSMEAMMFFTPRFTAEFSIRPFLKNNPEETYNWLTKLISHPDVHIRRWISEGTRPRLPWGGNIEHAIKNPKAGLLLLEKLYLDSEIYVRKSVANHLNDISKDHPHLVINILKKWNKSVAPDFKVQFQWLMRHALRTLIKKGDLNALELMGAKGNLNIKVSDIILNQSSQKISLPGYLDFTLTLGSKEKKVEKVIIDYAIYYKKKNGLHAPKVYKLKSFLIEPNKKIVIEKKHLLKKITTRKFYPGEHFLEIQLNGKKISKKISWNLSLK